MRPFVGVALALIVSTSASAEVLPSPLGLADVVRLAAARRDEIAAARERARAGEARPDIAGALDDPMISPSLDHIPFMGGGANWSVAVEQQFPLSGIRQHRRASALAEAGRLRADTARIALDAGQQAANAFLMLQERRRTAALVAEQLVFARDVVAAANARYAAATAPQSDVLRAEVEVARLEASSRALADEVRSAEAMLNASLALDPDSPVPPLTPLVFQQPLPSWPAVKAALESRPELVAGRADIARADADVSVMRDMFKPMATVRTGPAYTMTEGQGWMAMFGVTVPLWRGKLRAGVAEAEAMKKMSEADLRAMTRMIEGDAAAALSDLQAARERQNALTSDVLPRARMAIDPALAGYSAGQLPLVSVIEAVQALWMVQQDVVMADSEVGRSWARLGRALGSYEAVFP